VTPLFFQTTAPVTIPS